MAEENVETFSEETKNFLRSMFKRYDREQTGWLDADELEECLALVGIDLLPEDLDFLVNKFDKNGDKKLQISELMDNMHILYAHAQHKDDLIVAFKKFDIDDDGFIRFSELEKILRFKDFMSEKETRETISKLAKYDRNYDGKFSYSEFVEMFLSDDFANTVEKRQEEQAQVSQEQSSY